jgi:hypothetical protein
MLTAVRELLATGASAREVVQAIARRQAEGELDGLAAPSISTVKAIAREQPEDTDQWTLEDATPADGPLVLHVLSAVQRRSHGRVRHLTKREARIAAVILGLYQRTGEDVAWRAYVRAREYLAAVHRGDDPAAIHLGLFDAIQLDLVTADSASPAS